MTATLKHLTAEQIETIAERHGLEVDREVMDEAEQADRYHGRPDGLGGSFNAAVLLDGYLAETARVERAEGRAHADFRRNAYGE